ncbi:phosphoribosyltransferase [Mesorhizobium sp. Cs1321R2N1]|uniref:phosphoribosyltransferase n=1 Tax=Mesorhizobium sp. Cs1321R2N1 TaxID=3015174 RepID=UPI00301BFE2D
MTEVKVWSLVRHNTSTTLGPERNQDEWDAIQIKKIVKGDQLADKARFKWPGIGTVWREHRSTFVTSLCSVFATKMVADGGSGAVVVPIPNSSAVIGSQQDFRTLVLVRGIANLSGGALSYHDHLRWNGAVGKAHLNERARNVDEHMGNMAIVGKPDRKILLFDDMVTSGSQMCAATLKLEEAGFEVAGCYSVLDVLDEGERGTAPAWKSVTRHPTRTGDLFALLESLGLGGAR